MGEKARLFSQLLEQAELIEITRFISISIPGYILIDNRYQSKQKCIYVIACIRDTYEIVG